MDSLGDELPRRSKWIAERSQDAVSTSQTKNTSSRSVRTYVTVSSTAVRQQQLNVQTEAEIAKLDEEFEDFENKIELEELNLKTLMDELDINKALLDAVEPEDNIAKTVWQKEVSRVEKEI